MTISLTPSNPFVRVIYCISLIFIAFSLLRIFGVFNYKPGGEFMVAAAIAPTVLLLLLVVFRFIGVVIGKFKLNVAAKSGPIYILRMVSIFLMIASGLVAVFSVIGMLMSSRSAGAGFVIVSGIFGGGSPIGLLLFESSRLLEHELLIEPTKT